VKSRDLILLNAGFRIAYGIGGLLFPAAMGRLKLAADTAERPDARLFVRGFSAHQIGVAALGLASLRWRGLERAAAQAAVAIDAADMASAAVEAGKRRSLEADLVGGFFFSAAGFASAGGALRMSKS
jgi:hypothetical protein